MILLHCCVAYNIIVKSLHRDYCVCQFSTILLIFCLFIFFFERLFIFIKDATAGSYIKSCICVVNLIVTVAIFFFGSQIKIMLIWFFTHLKGFYAKGCNQLLS